MQTRIKIVGVQFAVNPKHKQGTPMTEEEVQRTVDFLTTLDRKHPRVSIRPEPTNEFDDDAFVVRFLSRKVGYVRNSDDCKAKAHAALEASGKGYFYANVVEVVIADNGYFEVEVNMDGIPPVPVLHEDRWSMWNPGWPLFPMTEEMLCVEDAICMIGDVLSLWEPQDRLSSGQDSDEDLREYVNVLVANGRHTLWCEAKVGVEAIVRMLEAHQGDEMRCFSRDLEHLLSGMCNERRLGERREMWLPELLCGSEAQKAWNCWLHMKQADTRELEPIEMTLWLNEIETTLANIPALAPCATNDDVLLLSRAYYTLIPQNKMRQLLTGLVVRKCLRERLGLPSAQATPAPTLITEMGNRFIATIIDYARTLRTQDEVEVLQTFIYRHMPYLPSTTKQQVDTMTNRFLPEEER